MSSKSVALALLVLVFAYKIATLNHNTIHAVSEKFTHTLINN
jgi:hypothetical protein